MEEAVLFPAGTGLLADEVRRVRHRHEYQYPHPAPPKRIPEEILYDNMKQVVVKRLLKQEDSTLNRQFEDFAGFYGFKPILINIKGESCRLKERKAFMRQKQQIVNTFFDQGNA